MEKPSNVSEYWFSNFYRVLVIDLNSGRKIVSVDVYRNKWFLNKYEQICVLNNKYCLLYSEVDISKYSYLFKNIVIEKIVITGIKSNSVSETINVKWFVSGEISYSDILKIFQYSWDIIGCKAPLENPWVINCID